MSVRFRTRAVRKDARASSPERAVRSRDATETVKAEEITARAAIRATEIITVRVAIRETVTETVRAAIREAEMETVRAAIRETVTEEMTTVRAATREEMTTVRVEIEAAWAFRSRLSIHRLHRSSRIRSRARTLTRKSMTQRKTAISR